MQPIRVVVAEHHPSIRAALCRFLSNDPGIQVLSQTSDAAGALQAVQTHNPDLLIVDLEMPGCEGVALIQRLHENHASLSGLPSVRILAVSLENCQSFVTEVLHQGADAYMLKDEADELIAEAVRRTAAGERGWIRRSWTVLDSSPTNHPALLQP